MPVSLIFPIGNSPGVSTLEALLNSNPMEQQTIKQHLSLEEKVDVFRNLFKGRENVFARR